MDDEEFTKLITSGHLYIAGYHSLAAELSLEVEISSKKKELNKYTDPSVREQITKKINLKEQELYRLRNTPRTEEDLEAEKSLVMRREKARKTETIERASKDIEECNDILISRSKMLAVSLFVSGIGAIVAPALPLPTPYIKLPLDWSTVSFFCLSVGMVTSLFLMLVLPVILTQRISAQFKINEFKKSLADDGINPALDP